jgi:hypothetical protein
MRLELEASSTGVVSRFQGYEVDLVSDGVPPRFWQIRWHRSSLFFQTSETLASHLQLDFNRKVGSGIFPT